MTMTRWNPWSGHSALRGSLERFSEPRTAPAWWRASGNLGIDVEDQSDHYRLTASLPGFEPDDVDVSITGRAVTVSAEHKTEQGSKDNPYILRERYNGAMTRRLILPAPVEGAKAKAEFKNGVLSIDLPKTAGAETQQVEITTALLILPVQPVRGDSLPNMRRAKRPGPALQQGLVSSCSLLSQDASITI